MLKFVTTLAMAALIGGTALAARPEVPARVKEHRMARAAGSAQLRTGSPQPRGAVGNSDKPLYGIMTYVEDGPNYDWQGAMKIDTNNARHTRLTQFDMQPFSGCWFEGKYLSCFHDPFAGGDNVVYVLYDASSWQPLTGTMTFTNNSPNMLAYGMTYDHTTGRIFSCFYASTPKFNNSEDAQFGYFDLEDPFDPVKIINSELPERMRALATDKDGQIYGLTYGGDLYKINKFTGEATSTGVNVELWTDGADPSQPFMSLGRESIAVDWSTGLFYLSYSDDMWDSYIACFDPATGESKTAADFSCMGSANPEYIYSDTFTGLYFEQTPGGTAGAPAMPTGITAAGNGIALTATVSFVLPSTYTDGNTLEGTLKWRVSDGSSTDYASGEAAPGQTVNATVTVPAPGKYSFVAFASAGDTESSGASASCFVGPDTPVIGSTPTTRARGNSVVLSWTAPSAANGGNLGDLTYCITRLPDQAVVAEAAEGLTFTDQIESNFKTLYNYIVEPHAGGVTGEGVTSRGIYMGRYFTLPHTDNFTDADLFMQYPVIDGNGDSHSWEINTTKYGGVAIYAGNNNNADDYLLIGPFEMQAGASYSFHFKADGHNITEYVALYVGTSETDTTAYTQLVAPTQLIPSKGERTFDVDFEPAASGDYYFAIKACSKANSQYIYVYEVAVKAVGGECPAQPSALDIVPGANSATIKATMPRANVDGSAIDALSEMRVYRDGQLIGSVTEGVAPGTELTFTDSSTDVEDGLHTYAVSAVSSTGEGKTLAAQCYRGLDYPGTPRNLRIWEDLDKQGTFHITFDAPERGYNGGYYNPDGVTWKLNYLVLGMASDNVELGQGTEHTFTLPAAVTTQNTFAGSVYGRNAKGEIRSSWSTQVATFGPAKPLPLQESWNGMTQKSGAWTGQSIKLKEELFESFWEVRDGSVTNTPTQDGDGGMLAFSSQADDGCHRVLSPRVTLDGATTPALVFHYHHTPEAKRFLLEIIVNDQPIATLRDLDVSAATAGTWQRVEVPLTGYVDSRYIQFGFSGWATTSEEAICIDNVTISDLTAHDLTVGNFTAPVKAAVNEKALFTATVRNNGSAGVATGDYTMVLLKNGEAVATLEGPALAPATQTTVEFTDIPVVTDPAACEYGISIEYSADERPDDNATPVKVVRIVTPDYPTVNDLKATAGNGVTLTWNDPSTADLPGVAVTETFENYDAFITEGFGQWTTHDGDGLSTVRVTLDGSALLEYPNAGAAMAWQVFDPAIAGFIGNAWYARSGKQMLVSFQATAAGSRYTDCDDWLISPELNASEQTISFYARPGMGSASPEVFDFMVSSTGNAPSDFEPLAEGELINWITDEWSEFTFRVPAGTRYFAIVHKSNGMLAMIVDDITYIPAGSSQLQLDLQGFNVYRDNRLLNQEPVTDNFYVDSDVTDGQTYAYNVTAVWDKGESHLSQTVTIMATSGIDGIETARELTVTVTGHTVAIDGGQGDQVAVYTTAGTCVGAAVAAPHAQIEVPAPGIYLVKAGRTVAKIVVK